MGAQANATVDYATALGGGGISAATAVRATGVGSTALGGNATSGALASGVDAIAIGGQSVSSTQYSVAIGLNAAASGTGGAVAIGGSAVSNNINTVALGVNASATGAGASALGTASSATGGNSTAVGVNSTAGGNFAFAGGFLSQATAVRTVAIGNETEATSDAATAVGNAARALGNSSLALGAEALAMGASTVSVGQGAGAGSTAGNTGSVALGIASGALVTGALNTAIGGGTASVMRGAGSGVTGTRNVAFGTGDGSVAYDGTLKAAAGSLVSGNDNVAIGTNAGIGVASNATTSIGLNANASAGNAIAIGTSAIANTAEAVAIGTNATATGGRSVSIGSGNVANGNGAVAIGDPNTATGDGAIANGMDNTATGNGSVAMGNTNMVGGGGQAVSVAGTAAQGAVGIGYQNTVVGQGSVAIGSTSKALAAGAVAFGDTAVANNARDVALGSGSVTAAPVATPSTVINGTTYNFAGITPTSTVSVGTGTVGGERTITNVAAGRLSATSTDAINGSQLYQTNQAVEAVATTAGKGWNLSANGEATPQNIAPGATADFANGSNTTVTRTGNQIRVDVVANPTFTSVTTGNTRIDNNGLTIVGGPSVTTTGINAGGTQITNVAAGTAATDAVNLTQLNNTVAGSKTKYYSVNSTGGGNEDNLGATGADAIASGKGATAAGASSVAMGLGATASTANSVALGAGSATATAVGTPNTVINGTTYNFQGITPVGTVSVGTVGGERTITNVAAGRLSASSTDAINGSQLYQTNQAIEAAATTAGKGWNLSANGEATPQNIAPGATADFANGSNTTVTRTGNQIRVDVVANPTFTSVTTGNTRIDNNGLTIVGGPSVTTTGINAGGTQITNVAAGTAATDAVNLTQLNNTVAGSKTKYYSVNSTGGGNEDNLGATGADAIASGKDAAATVDGGVALGSGSVSDRFVAPSTGSIPAGSSLIEYNTTDRTLLGALSVGSATSYRQITNVADGTQSQDAVTVRQLSGALQSFAVTPTLYFHANSTAADSLAIGAESVAVGPQTVVNGNNGVGIGNGAIVQQSAPGGIAIGQGATSHLADSIAMGTNASAAGVQGVALGAGSSVTQAGGVALGAGSVASTAAGVAGFVPPTATDAQRIAIGATTSTLAAVSVGDAANGQFRQITGVAAGTADSDAVNVSQLRGVQGVVAAIDQSTVKYDTNPDGSINYNSVSMGGSGATGPVTVHNVAPGVAGTDAVNVNQLNAGIAGANAYTDARVNSLGGEIRSIAKDASAGAAGAMAMANMPQAYIPGKSMVSAGVAGFDGQAALALGVSKLSDNGRWVVKFSGSANSRGKVGVAAGAGFHW